MIGINSIISQIVIILYKILIICYPSFSALNDRLSSIPQSFNLYLQVHREEFIENFALVYSRQTFPSPIDILNFHAEDHEIASGDFYNNLHVLPFDALDRNNDWIGSHVASSLSSQNCSDVDDAAYFMEGRLNSMNQSLFFRGLESNFSHWYYYLHPPTHHHSPPLNLFLNFF